MDNLDSQTQQFVEQYQESYIRYKDLPAEKSDTWKASSQEAQRHGISSDEGVLSTYPAILQAQIKIQQAPAAFKLPYSQKKLLKPPFKIRVWLQFRRETPLSISLSINAYCLGEQQLEEIRESRILPQKLDDIDGDVVTKVVPLIPTPGQPTNTVVTDFDFVYLKFKKSSRMTKRWLAFVLRLNGDDMCVLYTLPSIILSRKQEQFAKALEILDRPEDLDGGLVGFMGASRNVMGSLEGQGAPGQEGTAGPSVNLVMDYQTFKSKIKQVYQQSGLTRELVEMDFKWLAVQAGILSETGGLGEGTQAEVDYFMDWFVQSLQIMQAVPQMWNHDDPHLIASYHVDRKVAEAQLATHSPGVFLLRLSPDPGCLVLSTRVRGPDDQVITQHLVVDKSEILDGLVKNLIVQYLRATHVLDINSRSLHTKQVYAEVSQQQYSAQSIKSSLPADPQDLSTYPLKTDTSDTCSLANVVHPHRVAQSTITGLPADLSSTRFYQQQTVSAVAAPTASVGYSLPIGQSGVGQTDRQSSHDGTSEPLFTLSSYFKASKPPLQLVSQAGIRLSPLESQTAAVQAPLCSGLSIFQQPQMAGISSGSIPQESALQQSVSQNTLVPIIPPAGSLGQGRAPFKDSLFSADLIGGTRRSTGDIDLSSVVGGQSQEDLQLPLKRLYSDLTLNRDKMNEGEQMIPAGLVKVEAMLDVKQTQALPSLSAQPAILPSAIEAQGVGITAVRVSEPQQVVAEGWLQGTITSAPASAPPRDTSDSNLNIKSPTGM